MIGVLDYPLAVLAVSFIVQVVGAYAGHFLRKRGARREGDVHADFATIVPAALTLLSLIIGFSFAMAGDRYGQRKSSEQAEVNAVGIEYVRVELLPDADAAGVRALLAKYVAQRIRFYRVRDEVELRQINAETTDLQNRLWDAAVQFARAQPTPMASLVLSGMNDVLNSQGRTQAAWWNRIPVGAWALMGLVAFACNLLLGYRERREVTWTLLILPLLVSIPLFLISDIDSPRHGIIHMVPQNLIAFSEAVGAR